MIAGQRTQLCSHPVLTEGCGLTDTHEEPVAFGPREWLRLLRQIRYPAGSQSLESGIPHAGVDRGPATEEA